MQTPTRSFAWRLMQRTALLGVLCTFATPASAQRAIIGFDEPEEGDKDEKSEKDAKGKKGDSDAKRDRQNDAKAADEAARKERAARKKAKEEAAAKAAEAKRLAAEAEAKAEEEAERAAEEAAKKKAEAERLAREKAAAEAEAERKAAEQAMLEASAVSRQYVRKSGRIAARLFVEPGRVETGRVTELRFRLVETLKKADPRYGNNRPVKAANLVAEVELPKKGRKAQEPVRYAVHKLPEAGVFGIHHTFTHEGAFAVTIRGETSAGTPVALSLPVHVGAWPPPDFPAEETAAIGKKGKRSKKSRKRRLLD